MRAAVLKLLGFMAVEYIKEKRILVKEEPVFEGNGGRKMIVSEIFSLAETHLHSSREDSRNNRWNEAPAGELHRGDP